MHHILSQESFNNLPHAERTILEMLFAPNPDIDLINSLFASQVLGVKVENSDFYLSWGFVKKQIDFCQKVGLGGIIDNNVSLINFRESKLPIHTSQDSVSIYFSSFHTFDCYSTQKELLLYATDLSYYRNLGISEETKTKQYKAFQSLLDFPLPLFRNKTFCVKSLYIIKDEGILEILAKIYSKSLQQGAQWRTTSKAAQTNLEKIISLSK